MLQASAATIDSARAIVAAHASWATWALLGVVALEAIVIVALIRHHGAWDFIATLPTTNLRILVGIALFAFYNASLAVSGFVTKVFPPVEIILAIEGALLLNMGLDVTQYGVKRKTEDPDVIAANAAVAASCTPAPSTPVAPIAPAQPPAPTNAAQAIAAHRFTPGD